MGETISAAIGTLSGWLVGRRKNKAESVSLELENVKTILEINRTEFENLKKRVDQTQEELHHCRAEMERVLNEHLEELKRKARNESQKN